MDGIYLTDEELWALSRCSGVAVKAYLRLRARMDLRTGIVGLRSGVSYKMVQEWAAQAVEKGEGEAEETPTYKQARVAVAQLERRGLLLKVRQPPGARLLVFKCPMASLPEVRPKRTGHEQGSINTHEQGTEQGTNRAALKASIGAGFDDFDPSEQGTEPGTNRAAQNRPNGADIGVGVNPSLPQAASTDLTGVDAGEAIAAFGLAMKMPTAHEPQDELSRRATALAVALRSAGMQGVNSANPKVRAWAEAGAAPAQVVEALQVARSRRAADGNVQPIGPGYLDPIVREILNPPKRKAADAWWVSVPAMDAKARELGIATARAGESEQDYKARIKAALTTAGARQA